jgi:hypothetical protein
MAAEIIKLAGRGPAASAAIPGLTNLLNKRAV